MTIERIVPDLHAEDPAAGHGFYADVLGLEVVMDHGWIVTYADPANPAAQLSVMREDASAPVRPDVSIEVDDVDAAHAAAVRLGHEIVHPLTDESWGVTRFFYRDGSGRVVNVGSHQRGACSPARFVTAARAWVTVHPASWSPCSAGARSWRSRVNSPVPGRIAAYEQSGTVTDTVAARSA